jgi:hypothetical protein
MYPNNQKFSLILLLFSWMTILYPGRTEPVNLLVDDLTFTRPDHWKWDAPPASSVATNRFIIPDSGDHYRTDVRFYFSARGVEDEKKMFKSQFPDAREVLQDSVKAGRITITYLKATGSYVYKDRPPRPYHCLISACIPRNPKKFVYVRMLGPTDEVERETPTFKKMVEDACR